ncbi:MAG: tRNA (adenosine(37)-N6)-dimethylallyltransferase MiaA [Desulfobacterales bacterium]|nr:tRNA (adenosine(37)-N6)-dimethylallyltransferase MiaA [Desulfobacterales bacterium]MDJ0853566.1 tRNA (adenosine(37)-N6)-dimethylallyltransferase MiaA [Desulfobacterales bacterium]MDJ0886487.1 tRNA (adenosine(37)-N6)-dimethylallyltransferase MiaA [Desulfobacterales bacterium]MDJ0991859.1 tRNA (adenosine(37)-N6)-dimethylallyltransferase MiaA [Desulfobacterales bacterium]
MRTPSDHPRIVVICGPTGIGKTSAAIRLARHLGGEIVGADSMQIYRRMDIGTAKPTAAEQAAVTHHMIDVVEPDEPFDAARYATMATACIHRLHRGGILPVVAGGTGFYLKALEFGLFDTQPPDPQIRRRLERQAEKAGLGALYAALQRHDPASAARIHAHDRFRIIRALETLENTGQPISALQRRHGFARKRFETIKIGLTIDREALYARINRRVAAMLAEGLLGEVQSLLEQGYGADLKSMQSIGYRHMCEYLAGQTAWDATVDRMKRDTRRYAKRQFTWFKSDPDIIWSAPEAVARLVPQIEKFMGQGTPP